MSPTLSSLGEFGLIRRLQKQLGKTPTKNLIMGIGDDAAVRRIHSNYFQLLTHDLLLEGVHFLAKTPKDFLNVGWKALAVNLSDIAAMGGMALEAVVGIGIPTNSKLHQVDEIYRGLKQCAKKYSCTIVGGDTNLSKKGWVLAVTVLGYSKTKPLFRNGAKPGDTLWVTGTLGGAVLGWKAIQKKEFSPSTKIFRQLHARPMPRLQWGQQLLKCGMVSSMIDLSDGLAGDLNHISEASRVGFNVEVDKIPSLPNFFKTCANLHLDEIPLLLSGGEDYELLFTVKRGQEDKFIYWLKKEKIPATHIGSADKFPGLRYFKTGKKISKAFKGFRHF